MLSQALYPRGAWAQFVQITDSPHYLVPRATVNPGFPRPCWSAGGRGGHRRVRCGTGSCRHCLGPGLCGWQHPAQLRPLSASELSGPSAALSHPGSCITRLTITTYSFNKLSSVFALCLALQPMGWCSGWEDAGSKCCDGSKCSRKQVPHPARELRKAPQNPHTCSETWAGEHRGSRYGVGRGEGEASQDARRLRSDEGPRTGLGDVPTGVRQRPRRGGA